MNGQVGKGDNYRPVNPQVYGANFESIFPPRPPRQKLVKCPTCMGLGVVPNAGALYGEGKYQMCPSKCGGGMVAEATPSG